MTILTFSLSGSPRPQGRPRATTRGGFATVYKPSKDRKYEQSATAVFLQKMGAMKPLEGALSVSIRFRMPIPQSASKRVKLALAAGEIAHVGKPDLSNMVKSIEDAMNKVVFADDSQIVRLFTTKVYSDRPGVDVRVEALEPQD